MLSLAKSSVTSLTCRIKDPITDKAVIESGLKKMRDATKYVHDKTIEGMNAGKTVEQLMAEIKLPPELALTQEHGKVSWAVKSIWEYYATWFHFDKTTELYAVPQDTVYPDIVELAGADSLIKTAKEYNLGLEPLKALHLIDIVLANNPKDNEALWTKSESLTQLIVRAQELNNSYELYWLRAQLRETQEAYKDPDLDAQ